MNQVVGSNTVKQHGINDHVSIYGANKFVQSFQYNKNQNSG